MKSNIPIICSILFFLFCSFDMSFAGDLDPDGYKAPPEPVDAAGQLRLGIMYQKGQDVIQDYKEAEKLFILAAKQGNTEAQSSLGLMYFYGKGVIASHAKAYMWFNICAAKGNNDCIKNRDMAAKKIPYERITAIQQKARKCLESNYKNCD